MRKRKHPKLRACGRWGVWLCTVCLTVLLCVSRYQYVYYPYSTVFCGNGTVQIQEYRLNLTLDRPLTRSFLDTPVAPIAPVGSVLEDDVGPVAAQPPIVIGYCGTGLIRIRSSTRWWEAPHFTITKTTLSSYPVEQYAIDFPLVYVLIVVILWSLWLFVVNQRVRCRNKSKIDGCCIFCSYSLDGLSNNVCPECGNTQDA